MSNLTQFDICQTKTRGLVYISNFLVAPRVIKYGRQKVQFLQFENKKTGN